MAQKPEICGVPIHVCRTRITRLDSLGNVEAGPDNSYVSDKPISVVVTPVVEPGTESTLVGGCDCILASYKGTNKLKRFDLEIAIGAFEPAMLEMVLGATLIEDSSDEPVPIGVWWPNQLTCDQGQQPNVAIEFWSDIWTGDHQDADWPYMHHVYPSSYWQISAQRYENALTPTSIVGFTRTNPVWGDGPYGDQQAITAGPQETTPSDTPGGAFYTEVDPPTADCGYKTTTT